MVVTILTVFVVVDAKYFAVRKALKKCILFQKGGGVNPKAYIFLIKFLTKLETIFFKPGDQNESFSVKVCKIRLSV